MGELDLDETTLAELEREAKMTRFEPGNVAEPNDEAGGDEDADRE